MRNLRWGAARRLARHPLTRPILLGVLVVMGVTLGLPAHAGAQAICSAPHSSPSLAQGGSIGTLPAGAGWVQLSLYGQNATEAFNPQGGRQAFLGDSRFDTRSVYITAAVGLLDGLEVWGQLPIHDLSVEGAGGSSASRGVGDIRTAVRVSPEVLGLEWPVALRAGLKVPGSDFPVDATELPLSEGQRDVEVSLESGWTSVWSSLYVVGWMGYRWRSPDLDGAYEPGDEGFAHLALGGTTGLLHWQVGLDGMWGGAPVDQRVVVEASARRLLQAVPTLGVDAGPGRLEITLPFPLAGRNLPSDPSLSVGYRTGWGM